MAKNRADGECCGIEFFVDEFWNFKVPSLDKRFDSFEQMKAYLGANQKALLATKREKLKIAALDREGNKVTITGVHAGHGGLTTSPKTDTYTSLYPETKLTQAAIAEANRLQADLGHIEEFLKTQSFKTNRDHYNRWDISQHSDEIKRIKAVVVKAENVSNTNSLKEALASTLKPKKLRF